MCGLIQNDGEGCARKQKRKQIATVVLETDGKPLVPLPPSVCQANL